MQHSPSWEANWFSANQGIPDFMEPEGFLPIKNSPPPVPYKEYTDNK